MKKSLIVLAALACCGCTTVMRGYEAAAAEEIRNGNDNALAIWKASACVLPVGAVLRSPEVIESVNKFCGGAQSALGDGKQSITVNVALPPAASASSTK